MSRIPQTFIDELLNRVDIVEVIDHRVKLKKSGKNYSACCPFHDEKTPSFTVSQDKQFYYCFGCGATGNAVSFLLEYERLNFVDAVENLARVAGLQVPREEVTPEIKQRQQKQKDIYELLGQAEKFYKEQLKSNSKRKRAVTYLENRGLSGAIARDFAMGYAPPGWDNLLQKLGTSEHDNHLLVESGLVIQKEQEKSHYDRFRDRIMFPIHDSRGRTIGFGGRVLGDDKPKYLNSPETPVFQKGKELYGLYEAKHANRDLTQLIVVEGYMDVIALAQYGLRNAVATLGTACGEDHLRLAFRYVSEVVFCFDGDKAGRNAAKRALVSCLPTMTDGRQIRFLFLAEGQDPDTLVRQIGAERFQEQLKHATPLEQYLFEACAEDTDVSTMEGRAKLSKAAAPLLNSLPKGVFRELMFSQLATRTGLSLEVIMELTAAPTSLEIPPETQPTPEYIEAPTTPSRESLERPTSSYQQHQAPNRSNQAHSPPPQTPANRQSLITMNPARLATTLLLEYPQLLKEVTNAPAKVGTDNEELRRLFYLVDYLSKRETASFSSILGFWGGKYGVDEQQKLATLLANQLLVSVKEIAQYNPKDELAECFTNINTQIKNIDLNKSLSELKSKGLANLSEEEKERFKNLVRQQKK